MLSTQKQEKKEILDERMTKKVESIIPKNRQDLLKWYGWGYKDSKFFVKNGIVCFEGEKYPLEGCELPYFTEWVYNQFGVRVRNDLEFPEMPKNFPEPKKNNLFLEAIHEGGFLISDRGEDRLIRSHGQTLFDIYSLWKGVKQRIPDIVIWPQSHEDVVEIVRFANEFNVVLIPYGGGTSVSGAVSCPQDEERMIVALDTSQMNRMLWLDRENLTVCFESGVIGQDLERELRKLGLTVGHEPDSYEFSTLGGWVATRASGMKKNVYGNIEDLLVKVKFVTSKGVLVRECTAPRVSCGPDFNHIVMGSEGTLGIVTEVVLKVRPLPPVKRYGSLIFPNFENGVKFMREVAKRRCQPASVRLMDHEQFIFGQSLKSQKSFMENVADNFKKMYLSTIKRIDLNKICAATLLFEGESNDVKSQENLINEVARKYGGIVAGGQHGERGYILTFVIAYIRDFALAHEIVAESFETSVSWDRCSSLCKNVKHRIKTECAKRNIKYFLVSCRVTQTYDAGCCIYFYFAFKYTGISNPLATYEAIEHAARDEVLSSGGSLSHHHGVGKLRSSWYPQTVSEIGCKIYEAAKRELDPKNIFATGNLLPKNYAENLIPESNNNQMCQPPKSKL